MVKICIIVGTIIIEGRSNECDWERKGRHHLIYKELLSVYISPYRHRISLVSGQSIGLITVAANSTSAVLK